MIHQYRYLFVKKKVFNYSELHFCEGTFYKIHTLAMSQHQSIHVSNYSFIFVLGKFITHYGYLETIFKGIKISDQLGSAPLFCLAKKAFSRQRHRCLRNHKNSGFCHKTIVHCRTIRQGGQCCGGSRRSINTMKAYKNE